MALFLEHYGVTDAGKVRQNNEDSLLVGEGRDETLFVVADGIGGFEAGEVASGITIDTLKDLEPGGSFDEAVREANRRILAAAKGDDKLSGMGTTIVAIRFDGPRSEPVAEIAHVGDSRAYLVRDGELKPVTEDHSLVAELVKSGDLTRDQAHDHPQRNLITRALGAEEDVQVDTAILPVEAGDRFLLCSDGLSDMVEDHRISSLINEGPQSPEQTSHRLLEAALEAGGSDNITVVIVDVKDQDTTDTVPPVTPPPERESSTQELQSVAPSEAPPDEETSGDSDSRPETSARMEESAEPRKGRRPRGRLSSSERRRRKGGEFGKKAGRLVRTLAAVVAILLVLSPAYFWGSSRYYLEFDGGEVVAYRGLPYAPLGVELNTEWRRSGVQRSAVKKPYVARIESQKLYDRQQAEAILRDLGKE